MPLIFIPFFFRTYSSSVHSLSLFRFGNSDERTQKKERRVHICARVRVRVCSTYKSMNGRVSFTNLLCVFFVSIHINNIDDDSFWHSSAAFTCFVVFFLHSVLFRAIIFRNVQWLFYRSLIHRTSVCMKKDQKNIMRARGRRALTILYVFLCHSCLAKPANQHTHIQAYKQTLTLAHIWYSTNWGKYGTVCCCGCFSNLHILGLLAGIRMHCASVSFWMSAPSHYTAACKNPSFIGRDLNRNGH